MATIRKEMTENPEMLHQAPHTKPVKRLDDVKAARDLDLNFYGSLHEHP
jgi:glycine dehydrogenase subunit 2